MRKIGSLAWRIAVALVLLGIGLWGALALSYRLPAAEPARLAAGALWAALSLAAIVAALRRRWLFVGLQSVAFAAMLVWWATIAPRADKDWAPDVARFLTGDIAGDEARLRNVRDFDWRTDSEATERWEDRAYDLSTLQGVDLINSYWGGPAIAHTIVSFGFADGRHVAFSAEVRRRRGEAFSTIAGFFKEDELTVIAADERDVVRVRSNRRGEDVRLFHVWVSPHQARQAFVALVAEANDIAAHPRFYDTVTANCTTVVFRLARAIDPALPLDWRILVSGYLPNYAYDHDLLDREVPFAELYRLGRINERALAADENPDFSAAIRAGVPGP